MVHQYKGFAGAMQRMPKGQAFGIVFGGTFALSALLSAVFTSGGKFLFTMLSTLYFNTSGMTREQNIPVGFSFQTSSPLTVTCTFSHLLTITNLLLLYHL